MKKLLPILLVFAATAWTQEIPAKIGIFQQEMAQSYTTEDGLTSNNVYSIEAFGLGHVVAGTEKGLAVLNDNKWQWIKQTPARRVMALQYYDEKLLAAFDMGIYTLDVSQGNLSEIPADGIVKRSALPSDTVYDLAADRNKIYVATDHGLYILDDDGLHIDSELDELLGNEKTVHAVAIGPMNKIAVAADAGLFVKFLGKWDAQYPHDDKGRSWAPRQVKSVAFDINKNLWFASPQGAGYLGSDWTLFTGDDGLPYNDFTDMGIGGDGSIWFGTKIGAIRYRNGEWAYREGKRWLPNDAIRDLSVGIKGDVWFATSEGVGSILNEPMNLAAKADFYEEQTENYIKRTEYGYLSEVHLTEPGNLNHIIYSDSDNDGLWTGMYGAGECFAYAATKDPDAKRRANEAFRAMAFLSEVPVGGEVEMQPGFVARTVVPTSEPNPNERPSYSLEGMKRERDHGDNLWKVYYPRWPKSADGKYWYKTDTSSDELDGHYFFYAQYYELVAETGEEKGAVREVVRRITDHLIRNNYRLIDHDGTVTRWGDYSPESLNANPVWYPERGLKSLSMLSYLTVALHVTGDPKYQEHIDILCNKHHYDQNAMTVKLQRGIGSGNQSDDEMAIMGYYNIIRYTKDEALKREMLYSFYNYWVNEQPEMNPFFNFAYAACALNQTYHDPWGTYDLAPWVGWLDDSIATLKGFPLDRLNWPLKNSQRLDIRILERQAGRDVYTPHNKNRGYRVNGKVLPIENRHFNHWNTDPWQLNYGGDGRTLASGTVYLLPYYMGLYHGFIQ